MWTDEVHVRVQAHIECAWQILGRYRDSMHLDKGVREESGRFLGFMPNGREKEKWHSKGKRESVNGESQKVKEHLECLGR